MFLWIALILNRLLCAHESEAADPYRRWIFCRVTIRCGKTVKGRFVVEIFRHCEFLSLGLLVEKNVGGKNKAGAGGNRPDESSRKGKPSLKYRGSSPLASRAFATFQNHFWASSSGKSRGTN